MESKHSIVGLLRASAPHRSPRWADRHSSVQHSTPFINIYTNASTAAALDLPWPSVDAPCTETPRKAPAPKAVGPPTRPPPRHHAQASADKTGNSHDQVKCTTGERVETAQIAPSVPPNRHRDTGRVGARQNAFLVAACATVHARDDARKKDMEARPTTVPTRWLTRNRTRHPRRSVRSQEEREGPPPKSG